MKSKDIFYTLLLTVTCFLVVFVTDCAKAQGENNVWSFGVGAGLDFNSGEPEFINTSSNTAEGCASVCDSNGRLLFYSDGKNVWDRNHNAMPGGIGLLGNHGGPAPRGSATQGVAIVPFLRDPFKYYIFTVDCSEVIYSPILPGYLRYSVVDMSLNNGLGDVVEKNILLDSGTSEKMIVAKGDGCYLWLLVHMHSSAEFRAYKIDEYNEIYSPVSSTTSTYTEEEINENDNIYMVGEMKVSPDSRFIALTTGRLLKTGASGIELYRFNNRTGKIDSPVRVYDDDKRFLYGLSFSPGSSLLYVGPGEATGQENHLLQFDVQAYPREDSVRKSMIRVARAPGMGGMRIGPDNKIYITPQSGNTVRCISEPDVRGPGCRVTALEYYLPESAELMISFGNHVYSATDVMLKPIITRTDTFLCNNEMDIPLIGFDDYDTYTWSTGQTEKDIRTFGRNIWVRSAKSCAWRVDTFNMYTCQDCIYLPDAFTPNGDGRNDLFRPLGNFIEAFEILIVNRFGNMVYHSTDQRQGWNGMHGPSLSDIGTYFYYVKARCKGGTEFMLKGNILLIR